MVALAIAIVVILILILWYVGRKNTVFDNIFFDNNGTTQPHKEVVDAMAANSQLGNASSSYAWEAKKKLDDLRSAVLKWCRANNHKVIITSGASEANNLLIRSLVDYHWRVSPVTGRGITAKPHIILSSIEHKTSIECANLLREEGRVDVSFINPDIYGNINPKDVNAAINARTILISIMSANNEIGNIMPIQEIAAIAAAKEIPFHTDAVQTFGKHQPNMQNISALSMSFHKMHGPQGIGVLVLNNAVADRIEGQIAGSQNFRLRGGTENMAAVAGALKAMEITLTDRVKKNQHMLNMKRRIIDNLSKNFLDLPFVRFAGKSDEAAVALALTPADLHTNSPKGLVILGPTDTLGMPDENKTNPNTLLLSVVNLQNDPTKEYKHFCNIKLKSDLAADRVIVSIGSACQTGENGPSHVLENIKAPFVVRCGVVRISLGDFNTMAEVDSFCKKFIKAVWLQ